MSDKTTTTTTTEAENTTDTTTEVSAAANINQAEKQGEVAVDKSAEAHVLKEQSQDERLEDARNDAMRNHAAEHANDTESAESLASNDKVE